MARKKTARKKGIDRVTAFYEVLSMCGDPDKAARLVNMGMEQAHRLLRGPDGFDRVEAIHKDDRGEYYSMTPAQLKAFFTQGVACGVLPRVLLNMDTGLPLVDGGGEPVVIFEYVSEAVRMNCADKLGKMLGVFIDKKQLVIDTPKDPNELSAAVRDKLAETYATAKPYREEDDDDTDADPLSL